MTPGSKQRIAATYSAAADHYDVPALAYWNYFGRRTVEHAQLSSGAIVLDVCCGAGASAIPAALAVGPAGRVIGLDLAPPLLDLARAKAPTNAEFRHADFEQAYFRPATFDAVLCVFGIFFIQDMAAALQRMWRLLRPGGKLAITVWGEDAFEPLSALFPGPSAWTRLAAPGAIESLFAECGIGPAHIVREDHSQAITSPEVWWDIGMGSGFRATIDQLSPEERDKLRARCVALTASAIRLPVTYAVASR